jgi:D-alanyl-lipoteichoic acid acyltransferase DltB (MBOAT superfamily)
VFATIYWLLKSNLFRNSIILLFGYLFYYLLDQNFIILLLTFTLFTYTTGILIGKSTNSKRLKFTVVSITICLLTLLTLKTSFLSQLIPSFFFNHENLSLKIIAPLGISFYFIHGITYLSDVYNHKIKHETNLLHFSIFINFFPLLIAGPIERANHLLPQIKQLKTFNNNKATSGLKHILWGLTQKLIISNLCSSFSNYILDAETQYSGSTILLALMIYSINIYADFAGYSNIAIGLAKILGFEIQKNFNYPYFSSSIKSFWRNWHISLSNFFKDYIYIPLGGNSKNDIKHYSNIFIVFILSGIWHGTTPNFLLWGFYHFMIYTLSQKFFRNKPIKIKPKIIFTTITFCLISIGWVFFRTNSTNLALLSFSKIFSTSLLQFPDIFPKKIILSIIIFMLIEFHWYKKGEFFNTPTFNNLNIIIRWGIYCAIILLILYFSSKEEPFIYFQF